MEVGGGWGKFLEDKPHSRSILEAQKYIRERLEKKHLAWFLASKEFQDRQSPKLSVSDSADDVVTQKRKRTAAVLKVFRAQEQRFYNMLGRKPPIQPRASSLFLPPIVREDKRWVTTKNISFKWAGGEQTDTDSVSSRRKSYASTKSGSHESKPESEVLSNDEPLQTSIKVGIVRNKLTGSLSKLQVQFKGWLFYLFNKEKKLSDTLYRLLL